MSRKQIHKGRIVDLGLEQANLPNGAQVTLEIIRHPGAAAIVPLHEDGTVTLVKQYRHAVGKEIYEVPAGVLENNEKPVDCAARELAEEVQLAAQQYEKLSVIHTTPGFTDETIWIFLAKGLQAVDSTPDWDESLQPVRIALTQAIKMIENGEITDGKTICALYLAAGKANT